MSTSGSGNQPVTKCELFDRLLAFYTTGSELVLHRSYRLSECLFSDFLPCLRLRVTRAHRDWDYCSFHLYHPSAPLPLLESRLITFASHLLVLRGQVTWCKLGKFKPRRFHLKFTRRLVANQDTWLASLTVSGQPKCHLRVFPETHLCSTPEPHIYRPKFGERRVPLGTSVLYQNCLGLFAGWYCKSTWRIAVDFGFSRIYPDLKECLFVSFSQQPQSPRVIEGDEVAD